MTLFLSGTGGWIGGHVARVARAEGLNLVAVARGEVPTLHGHKRGEASFVHLAWPSLPRSGSGASALENWQSFEDWTLMLQRECIAAGVAFVGIGSGIELVSASMLQEPSGYADYRRMKLRLHAALAEREAALCWVRLHFLFGSGEARHRFVPAAFHAARHRSALSTGPLARTRRWMEIRDCATELVRIARAPPPGALDLCGFEDVSFGDMIGLIEIACAATIEVAEMSGQGADARVDSIRPIRLHSSERSGLGGRSQLAERLQSLARTMNGTE